MFHKVVFAVLAAASLSACGARVAPASSNSSGSLALSQDEQYLYAVDADNDLVTVVDTHARAAVAQVKVGTAPERIAVGADESVYVSNRGNRSVSVFHKGTWSESARIPVGVEPVGLAVSSNGKTLYVVNSTTLDAPDHGSVMAIDTATGKLRWELPVGEEPRAIRLLSDSKALVTLYKQGDVLTLDLNEKQPSIVSSSVDAVYKSINQAKQSGGSPSYGNYSSFKPRGMSDIVVSPDGKRYFATATLAREDAIAFPPGVYGGYYHNGGPCNLGAITTPGLLTFGSDGTPLTDDLTACATSTNSSTADFPPTTLGTPDHTRPVQGPAAVAFDPTGSFLYVVNKESSNVAVLPAYRRDVNGSQFDSTGSSIQSLVQVGAGPTGIALTADGKTAYVYSAFDHTLSVLGYNGANVVEVAPRVALATDSTKLSADALAGRKLFFGADNASMNNLATGVSCNTCHTEGGREDGHVWLFPDGPRQTPSLAGRMMLQTAPYHWTGEFSTLQAFLNHTVTARMGGAGIDATQVAQLSAYIGSLQPLDNPKAVSNPSAAQIRGAQVFVQAGCNGCHAGQALTDDSFHDVGTIVAGVDQFPQGAAAAFNVPSLLGLGRSAPYLHDGSALTLRERLVASRGSDTHGKLASMHVTDAQIDDLVEYLQGL